MKGHTLGILAVFVIFGFGVTKYFNTDYLVQQFLYAVTWFCGIYYFYTNSATEDKWGYVITETKATKRYQFFLVAIQVFCFHLLWFLFELEYFYYALDMCVINLTYLIWDFKFRDLIRELKGRIILALDISGFAISLVLAYVTLNLPSIDLNKDGHHAMWVVSTCTAFIIHSLLGLIIVATQFKYNPFKIV